MSHSVSLEEQPSLFSREGSFDPSFIGLVTSDLRILSIINEAHLLLN